MGGAWGGKGRGARERIRRELDDEIELHIQLRTEELISRGMTPEDARREAVRRFGDLDEARARAHRSAELLARRARWAERLDSIRGWFAHGVRQVRRAPGFTALSVLIFALGVGLTTATFTVVDHVLLRPLPFPAPERLVALQGMGEQGNAIVRVSMGNWYDWKAGAATLAGTAIHQQQEVTVLSGDDAFWATGALVSGPLFETLGLEVERGRPLTEQDGQDRAQVVAISHALWTRVFGRAPDLGSLDLTVNGRTVEVVGVVRSGHEFPGGTEVWIPVPNGPGLEGSRNNINYEAVARLAPGIPAERAEEELTSIALGIREGDPEAMYSYGVRVLPLRDVVVGEARGWLRLLIGAVFFVLLIACANLAGLGLARGRRRERDTAVRLALGARRGQIVGEQLSEHVVTAVLGGAIGVAIAALGTQLLLEAFAGHLPRSTEISFDLRVVGFGMLAAVAAGLLAGLAPAVRGSKALASGLVADARGGVRGGRGLPGAVMVGTEVAIAVTLLVGGGLLLRSLMTVAGRDLGYDPEDVLVLDVALTAPEYRGLDRRIAYWDALVAELEHQPAVAAVGLGNWIPTGGGGTSFVEVEGRPYDPNEGIGYRVVGESYFEVMGIPLQAGRRFEPTDDLGTGRVGIVNAAAAHRFWTGQSPVGRRVKVASMEAYYSGGEADWIEVVGVVGDVRHFGMEAEPTPELFVLHRQMPAWTGYMSVVVEPRPGAPPQLIDELTRTVRSLDPRLAVESSSLEQRVRALLAQRRLVLAVLGVFAASAVLLVSLGIYGLVSFAVAQRTREIAVRAALGAARGGIMIMVIGNALRVVVAGAAAGLAAAMLLRRILDAMVVGVSTADPLTYLGAATLMVLVAAGAALLPSLRAARMDPLEALRRE